jgi:hypothetical protein
MNDLEFDQMRHPGCHYRDKGTDENLAAQLGDGKETDDMTNRLDSQTDPALFAAPHFFTLKGVTA